MQVVTLTNIFVIRLCLHRRSKPSCVYQDNLFDYNSLRNPLLCMFLHPNGRREGMQQRCGPWRWIYRGVPIRPQSLFLAPDFVPGFKCVCCVNIKTGQVINWPCMALDIICTAVVSKFPTTSSKRDPNLNFIDVSWLGFGATSTRIRVQYQLYWFESSIGIRFFEQMNYTTFTQVIYYKIFIDSEWLMSP